MRTTGRDTQLLPGRARLPAVVAGATLLLAGCAAPTPALETPEPPEAPAGLSVLVVQNRTDLANSRMQIRVVNDGADPVTVAEAAYRDVRFVEPAEWTGDTTVPAGTARDLPVPIPPAACGTVDASAAIVELRYLDSDSGSGVLELEPTDPFDLVATVTAAECTAEAVRQSAEIVLSDRIGFEGSGPDEVALLTVRVTATGSEPVTIDEVQGTVLLQPDDGTIAWVMAGTTPPGTTRDFPLRVTAARCDPHVVAEDKVGTLLPVLVTVGGAEQAQLTLAASSELRAQLYDYVGRSCGWG